MRGTAEVAAIVRGCMKPRFAIPLVATLALAACGSDDATEPSTTVTVAPPATDEGGGHAYATGADDVVLRITDEGGFVPVGYAFARTPSLLVTGDGRVFTPGVTTLEHPGSLISPIDVRAITPEGIQSLLALADEYGLLDGSPVYATNDQIADATTTVVELTVGGVTYTHSAYALGFDEEESDAARQRLADFVAAINDVPGAAGEGHLGEPQPFVPESYEIQAIGVDPYTIEGVNLIDWASDSGLSLNAASECMVVPASDVAAIQVLTAAKQDHVFREGGATYSVSVRTPLPGGPTC
jgi:hypothetical protein